MNSNVYRIFQLASKAASSMVLAFGVLGMVLLPPAPQQNNCNKNVYHKKICVFTNRTITRKTNAGIIRYNGLILTSFVVGGHGIPSGFPFLGLPFSCSCLDLCPAFVVVLCDRSIMNCASDWNGCCKKQDTKAS